MDHVNLHQIVICSFSICLPFQTIFGCFLPLLPFSSLFSGISHVPKIAKINNNALDFHRLFFYFSSEGKLSDSVDLRTELLLSILHIHQQNGKKTVSHKVGVRCLELVLILIERFAFS